MSERNSSLKSRLFGWALLWGSDRRLVWGTAALVGFGSYLAHEFAGGLTMSAVFAAISVAIIGTHRIVRLFHSRRERIRGAAERAEVEAVIGTGSERSATPDEQPRSDSRLPRS